MFDDDIQQRARAVLDACRAQRVKLVAAESCTGGLVTGALTAVAGFSDVIDRGFVVYSYEAKSQMLGVPMDLILTRGAVSEEVARAMAQGALAHAHPYAQVSIAVTGVAGPGSDSQAKPEGLVHFAAAQRGKPDVLHEGHELGDIGRDAVRRASVLIALDLVLKRLATD